MVESTLDPSVAVALVSVMAAALILAVGLLCMIAFDLRRALRRVEAVLPHCDQAFIEAKATLRQAHQLLGRANEASREVEGVVGRVCDAAAGAVEGWTGKIQSLFTGHVGNGAGSRRSRRSFRRSRGRES